MKGYSKYRAVRTPCNHGHKHPSKREAKRCNDLHLLQRAGAISQLTYEPVFRFEIDGKPVKMRNGSVAKFTPDFQYFEDEKHVVEDVKGMMVRDMPLRLALFRHLFPEIELRVVK